MILEKIVLIILLNLIITVSSGQQKSETTSKEINNISYVEQLKGGVDSLQMLNIVLPEKSQDSPILIWIGGGAWSYTNRNMEMDLGRRFAKEGIAFASVGHRLSAATWKIPTQTNGVKHPAHINDLALALKWIFDHDTLYGYSRDKIFVGGFSSGAHLTALLAMDERYLQEIGLSGNNIKGIIPIAGAYDILNYYNGFLNSKDHSSMAETHVKAVFGEAENDFYNASPTTYIDNLKIPMLLISENTTYEYTKLFEDRLRASSYRNFQVLHINYMGHGELWKNLSYQAKSTYRDYIIAFIKQIID